MMTSQVTSLGTIPPDSTFDLSLFSTLASWWAVVRASHEMLTMT
ncbi:hypothetical protein GCM10025794_34470 [Massilia kyonggiensis]